MSRNEPMIVGEGGDVLYCPTCGSEYRPEIAECVDCHVALLPEPPETIGRERAPWFPTMPPRIPRVPDDRPWLYRVIAWCAAVSCALDSLDLIAGLSILVPGLGFRWKLPSPWGPEVPPAAAALLSFGAALLAFLIAFGFWRRRPWSRHVLLFAVVADAVRHVLLDPEGVRRSMLWLFYFDTHVPDFVLTPALVVWICYLHGNARAYFALLRQRSPSG